MSVVMITKNCADNLERCLSSLHRGFVRGDEEILIVDTGSTDDTTKVAAKWGARVIERPDLRKDMGSLVEKWLPDKREKWKSEPMFDGGCIMDFAAARQISTDEAKHDCIFWIDSDDVLQEKVPGRLRSIIDQHWEKIDSIYMDYVYSFDEHDKRCTTILKRERVVDRRNYFWAGRCHETLLPRDGVTLRQQGYFADSGANIVHIGHRLDHEISDIRNYCIIRSEIEEDKAAGRAPDVRSLFYLGNAARGLKLYSDAVSLYQAVLQLSGSKDDRFSAAYYTGVMNANPEVGRPVEALDDAFLCMRIKPEDPRGYFLASRAYCFLRRWNEAIHWFRTGRQLPEPKNTLHSYDPEHIFSLPLMVAIEAAKNLGATDMAFELTDELMKRRPTHPDVIKTAEHIKNWAAGKKLAESVTAILSNCDVRSTFAVREQASEILSKVKAVPSELEDRGINKIEPEDTRPVDDGKDVAIFCGHTAEPWGPENAKTGIGGSEKMVLCMAPRLQAAGFRVSVYANVPFPQRGLDKETNVLWRHWSEFDYKRYRDTVIFWRSVASLEIHVPCKRRVVWCHDVLRSEEWTDLRIAAADQVWVQTQYHAHTLNADVRKKLGDKLVVTRNGIDRTLFEKWFDKIERKPTRVVFCSSPDRGVLTAIKTFQKAFTDVPDAELHICYGFTKAYWHIAAQSGYMHMCDIGRAMNLDDYCRMVRREIDGDPRIHFHGRLNWEKVCQLLCSSGVWLYPTRFCEISCMAAMEAQAAGCAIVATEQAALKETINWEHPGTYPTMIETAAQALRVAATTEFDRSSLSKNALDRFDFEGLTDAWTELLS